MQQRRHYLIFGMVTLFLLTVWVYVFGWGGQVTRLGEYLLFLTAPLAATIAGLFAVATYGRGNPHGRALLFVTLGMAAWFAGEVLWFYFDYVARVMPFPSLADVFYLAAYPLLFMGLMQERSLVASLHPPLGSLPMLLVWCFAAALIGVTGYVSVFLAYDPSATLIVNSIAIGYGVGDVVLVVAAMMLLSIVVRYRGGKFYYSWIAMLVGFLATLVADMFFAVFTIQYEAWRAPAKYIDFFWVAGYWLFAYGLSDIGLLLQEVQERLKREGR